MTTHALQDTSFARPDQELVDRLAKLPAANIGDAMDRLGVADSAIQAIWPGAKIAGPAFTVWTRPGDNQGIHQALGLAKPGDVIVVSGGGDESRALLGELIGERAINLGIAGFALDGAARDAEALGEIGMPVFARAITRQARTRTGRTGSAAPSPSAAFPSYPATSSSATPTASWSSRGSRPRPWRKPPKRSSTTKPTAGRQSSPRAASK
jgi:regulator of RNase E activity RraA